MDFPLLQTKLYIPTPRPDFVSRPRLIEKLNHGHSGKLTCVAAPAGFGKTTLVSDWLHQLELPVGWLSLDERDNDLTRFLTYLIAALQEVDQAIGKATQKLLQSTQAPNSPLPPPETLFTTFITEISAAGANLVLALDDYHFITDQAIHKAMGFFLDHLPPLMHLVITTRHDPGFPLSRLRVKGQLMEIGIDDLRFSPEETAEFLNRAEGLALSDEEIAILEHRTEGWITGLRLAALSAKDYKYSREATGKFIDAFAGDDRMVADYLMDEVLAQRPKDMQVFLLQASILDRFCGSLCNAVCSDDAGGAQGQEMLAQLDQANLFVIPLDSQRQWYRFHKLFADFLRQRLDWVYPEQIAVLHDRAAHWYEANDVIPEAIDHFLAARDFENAARLVERVTRWMLQNNEVATLQRWLDALPKTLARTRPALAMIMAAAALGNARFGEAKAWVETAERAMKTPEGRISLPFDPLIIQGYLDGILSIALHNLGEAGAVTIPLCRRALDSIPEDDFFYRGLVTLNLGDGYVFKGEFESAEQVFADAVALAQLDQNQMATIVTLGSQGRLYQHLGDLHRAAAIYRQAIELGHTLAGPTGEPFPSAGKAYASLSSVLYEWNELNKAGHHALAAVDCCQQWGHGFHLLESYFQLIRVQFAQGETARAYDTLRIVRQVANQLKHQLPVQEFRDRVNPWLLRIQILRLIEWLKAGELEKASQWLAENRHHKKIEVEFGRAYLSLFQGQLSDAWQRSIRLGRQLVPKYGVLARIEALLLQALILNGQDQSKRASSVLKEALLLAEPGGYIRVFLEKGAPIAQLLENGNTRGIGVDYVQTLRAAFKQAGEQDVTTEAKPEVASLVEPLSQRELEVLNLMPGGLTYKEIADQLFISLNTVRSHTKNIYGKLNAHNRTQAIARARELRLL